MIQDTIAKIEAQIQKGSSIKDENKAQLLGLLATLKSEIEKLAEAHGEQAESIAGFTRISTHEATRQNKDLQLMKLSAKGLSSSVKGFEMSHPKLVEIVNSISQLLSNMGI